MPMRGELPIRAVCERVSMVEVVWSHLIGAISNPNLLLLAAFWLLVCLMMINAVLYFPNFGQTIAMLEPF
jgi:hypothetical protein